MRTIEKVLEELGYTAQEIDLQVVGLKKIESFPEKEGLEKFVQRNAKRFAEADIEIGRGTGELMIEQRGIISLEQAIHSIESAGFYLICFDRFRKGEGFQWTHHMVFSTNANGQAVEKPKAAEKIEKAVFIGVKVWRNVKVGEDGKPYLSIGIRALFGTSTTDQAPKELTFKDGQFGVVRDGLKDNSLAVALANAGLVQP